MQCLRAGTFTLIKYENETNYDTSINSLASNVLLDMVPAHAQTDRRKGYQYRTRRLYL
jgi:hypothetical protein